MPGKEQDFILNVPWGFLVQLFDSLLEFIPPWAALITTTMLVPIVEIQGLSFKLKLIEKSKVTRYLLLGGPV